MKSSVDIYDSQRINPDVPCDALPFLPSPIKCQKGHVAIKTTEQKFPSMRMNPFSSVSELLLGLNIKCTHEISHILKRQIATKAVGQIVSLKGITFLISITPL